MATSFPPWFNPFQERILSIAAGVPKLAADLPQNGSGFVTESSVDGE